MASDGKELVIDTPMVAADEDPLLADVRAAEIQGVPVTALVDLPFALSREAGLLPLPREDGGLEVAMREGADPLPV
jgi:hypothetical protein